MGKKNIKQESSVPFLGVLLDSNLNWKNHLTELSKKLARATGIFYKIRHYAPRDTLTLLYHAVYAPFLSYDVSVWGLTHPSLLGPIFILQKKVLRIIVFNEKTAPSAPMFDSLRNLKLNNIITYQITYFVFECVHNLAPSVILPV